MTTNTNAAPDTEKRRYADGTAATGVAPLPDYSPRQQTAFMDLQALESMIGGRNGPSIRLRSFIGGGPSTAARHHVQIPPENVHIDCDVSRKSEKVDTFAAPKEAKTEPTEDEEQAAFEEWLARTCPSGDEESVQRQWEQSSDYLDLFDVEAEPVQQPDALARIKELERERDHALMAAEAEAREVDRLRAQLERVPLTDEQINKSSYDTGVDGFNFRLGFRMGARFAERAHSIQPAHKG